MKRRSVVWIVIICSLLVVIAIGYVGVSYITKKENDNKQLDIKQDTEELSNEKDSDNVQSNKNVSNNKKDSVNFYYRNLEDGTIAITKCVVNEPQDIVEIPSKLDGKIVSRIVGIFGKNIKNVKKVVIPESVKEIHNCFDQNTYIEEVEMKGSIEIVGENSFVGCSKIKKLEFKDGLKYIENAAIYGCENLEELYIPGTVQFIGDYQKPNDWSNNIKESRGLLGLACANKLTIHAPKDTLVESYINELSALYKEKNVSGKLKVNYDFVFVADETFTNHSKMKSTTGRDINFAYVVLDDGTLSIYEYYTNTTKDVVEIPEQIDGMKVSKIENLFYKDENVKKVILPNTLKEIGDWCFVKAKNLEEIQTSENLEKIARYSIFGCDKLKSLRCYDKLNSIASGISIAFCSDDLTIVGPANSFIEKYAKKQHIDFKVE